jgi:hypothetical protein
MINRIFARLLMMGDADSGSDWGEHLRTTGTEPHTTLDLTHVRHSRLTPVTPPKPGKRSTSATESVVAKSAGAQISSPPPRITEGGRCLPRPIPRGFGHHRNLSDTPPKPEKKPASASESVVAKSVGDQIQESPQIPGFWNPMVKRCSGIFSDQLVTPIQISAG